jgi:phage tail-like protein
MPDPHGYKNTQNVGQDPSLGSHFRVEYGASKIDYVFKIDGIGDETEMVPSTTGDFHAGLVGNRAGLTRMQNVTIERYHSGDGALAKIWKAVQDAKDPQVTRSPLAVQILDDTASKVAMEITFFEAWMKEYRSSAFDARSTELATESATFVCESFTVRKT